jgi:hypothetical protein
MPDAQGTMPNAQCGMLNARQMPKIDLDIVP